MVDRLINFQFDTSLAVRYSTGLLLYVQYRFDAQIRFLYVDFRTSLTLSWAYRNANLGLGYIVVGSAPR